MGIKRVGEYIDSLRELKPTVYMLGAKVKNYVDHPLIRRSIDVISENYRFISDARSTGKHKDLAIASSYFTRDEIARFNQIHKSQEDLLKIVELLEILGYLSLRHMTNEPLNSLFVTTYEMDQKHNTDYHSKFIEFVKRIQGEDLFCAITQTDPKGDRSLGPSAQKDPDLYLRIVEKTNSGIIVNGAKVHVSNALGAHELLVIPCRAMSKDDEDYAASFAVPVDTKGITIIPRIHPVHAKKFENPISSKYATQEAFVVFDHVFIPWDRVFMCGEWNFTGRLIEAEAAYHRCCYCGYHAGLLDLLIGAAALAAEYNGVEKASSIREKITDLILQREIVYSCGIAASVSGVKTPSGAYMPYRLRANVGKHIVSTEIHEAFKLVQDIAGGLVFTMPSAEDYSNPLVRRSMEKYFTGKTAMTERRLLLFRLIEDLTLSEYGAWWLMSRLHGGGSPAASRIMMLREYDLEKSKKMVEGILESELSAIKRNL